MIFGGSAAYESKRKHKLVAREINALTPATPKYFKWSELPITFNRSDHPESVPHPGHYPLVLDPIVRMVKLNKVIIDGGSGLSILFAKTLDDMKIPRSVLNRSSSPFHGVIPGTSATPLGQTSLPVTLDRLQDGVSHHLREASPCQVYGSGTLDLHGNEG